MDKNKEILQAIAQVRTELKNLRAIGQENAKKFESDPIGNPWSAIDRTNELECFERLIALYGALNAEVENEVLNEIEKAA